MKKVGKPKTTDPKILGNVLQSTVDQTASLGRIGVEVLDRFGIKEIDLDKHYPSSIRAALHKAVLERFGEFPLFYFGVMQPLEFKGRMATIQNRAANFYLKNKRVIESSRKRKSLDILRKYFTLVIRNTNEQVSYSTQDNFFGCSGSQITDTEFRLQYRHPSRLFQTPFNQGFFVTQFRFFRKNYEVEFNYDANASSEGDGWGHFVWEVNFSFKKTEVSLDENLRTFYQKSRDKFFQCVIEDADHQKREAEIQKEKMIELSKQLAKYLPPQIHEALLGGDYDTAIATRRKKLTIFFSDIINFTSTSEGLQPEDLTRFLNEYFSEMTSIALKYGATIDKYIGDAMMLFFGDTDSKGEKEDARACVKMAIKMQQRMLQLQKKWRNQGFSDPFRVRIGINTGYCNVGNFGSKERLTYTIIGGEVNIAQRLESNADPDGILMSYETYAHAQDLVDAEEKESIKMKGINREIKIFSVNNVMDKKHIEVKSQNKIKSKNQRFELERLSKRILKMEKEIRVQSAWIKTLKKESG